jgi:hypothetical protein
LAAFGATTASIRAFPHFTYPLTIRGALFADLGACATGEFVKFRAEQHEMSGRPTNLGASHHQGEVLGFGMLTADLQTMSHRRRQARLITAQTFGDAALHLIVDHMHRIAPFTICAQVGQRYSKKPEFPALVPLGAPKGLQDIYGQGTVSKWFAPEPHTNLYDDRRDIFRTTMIGNLQKRKNGGPRITALAREK